MKNTRTILGFCCAVLVGCNISNGFASDGTCNEWAAIAPLLSDISSPDEQGLSADFNSLSVSNDGKYLYFYGKTNVNLDEWEKNQEKAGYTVGGHQSISHLYLDIDNDPKTGSKNKSSLYDYEGYEFEVVVSSGEWSGKPIDLYKVNKLDSDGTFSSSFDTEVEEKKSSESNPVVARCEQGIEFALLMSTYGLAAGKDIKIRIVGDKERTVVYTIK